MNKQSKILLATDYSHASSNAEQYAIKLAAETGAFLQIVHIPESASTSFLSYTQDDNTYKFTRPEESRLRKHILKTILTLGLNPMQIHFDCVVRDGTGMKQIYEEAIDIDADFIIAGNCGSGQSSAALGSLSRELIMKSNLPVLLIPCNSSFKGIKRIVFATGYRDGELPIVNFLSKIARNFEAELTILHITPTQMSPEFKKKTLIEFSNEIKSKIAYPNIQFEIVHFNDISGGLDAYAIENKTDWMVMSPERPLIFEKIFNQLTLPGTRTYLQSNVPLFTIPDFYSPDYSWFWRSLSPGQVSYSEINNK